MTGWLTHTKALIRSGPEFKGMFFNSALGFLALGIALVLPAVASEKHMGKRAVIGWGLIVLVGVVLSQYATGIDLPIDWPRRHNWLEGDYSDPGRMPIISCRESASASSSRQLMRRR